ncbi:C39 family peptidase [Secundilactobacillus oryzae]|nr:C39 family peptidase [Secundilactobacillus oryzae]
MKRWCYVIGGLIGVGVAAALIKRRVQIDSAGNYTLVFDDFGMTSLEDATNIAHDDRVLVLAESSQQATGQFVMPQLKLPAFKKLVASWNAYTPGDSSVEVEVRVLVNKKWSLWHTFGRWGLNIMKSSTKADIADSLAGLDTDTLFVRGQRYATAVQARVRLNASCNGETPTLKLLAVSTTPKDGAFTRAIEEDTTPKVIDAPAYSQEIRDGKMAPVICSPTTLASAMNLQGKDVLPEEVAYRNYDLAYQGFGNWSFSTATAGAYGFKSYAIFTDINKLKNEVDRGYPVGVSVQYTNNPQNHKLPYLENAPGETYGHLLLVTGFITEEDETFVVTNDSYAPTNESANRVYKLDQFKRAWHSNLAYIIGPAYDDQPVQNPATRKLAKLQKVDGTRHSYELLVGQKLIPLPVLMTAKTDPLTMRTGTVAYTLNDEGSEAKTLAERKFYYAEVDDQGHIQLDWNQIQQANDDATGITVYVMQMAQPTYVANLAIERETE